MNYLAHLHIAEESRTSYLGNLLGDFVKGNPEGRYAQPIVEGIKLHRFVDSYTDRHPIMKKAKSLFPEETKRYSPIALDMYWDHALAKYWGQFHYQSLNMFCLQAEKNVNKDSGIELPERFVTLNTLMWKGRWLESYGELDNIGYALQRMSMRSDRMGPLADCFETLERHQSNLDELFHLLYPDVLVQSKKFASDKEI